MLSDVILWTVGTDEGIVIVLRVMVKGEPVIREPWELRSVGLVDKGESLNAPNKGTKSSLLAMVSLEYVGQRNGLSLRLHLRGKG